MAEQQSFVWEFERRMQVTSSKDTYWGFFPVREVTSCAQREVEWGHAV